MQIANAKNSVATHPVIPVKAGTYWKKLLDLLIIIAVLLLNNVQAGQKFYKWTDANGNIHYTDKQPEDKKTAEVKVNTSQPHIIENNENNDKKPKAESNTREKLDEYSQRDKINRQNTKIKKQNCKNAKNRLKKFKESITYRKKDPKSGGYTYPGVTGKAKLQAKNQKKIDQYQQNINKSCQ